jgi:hypothetical protein
VTGIGSVLPEKISERSNLRRRLPPLVERAPGRRQKPCRKELHHPVVGDLTLDWGTLTCAADPDQRLIVRTAEPGSPTREALRTLAAKVTEGGS